MYDLLGREVETLIDEYRPAGRHSIVFNASALPSGLYFYRIEAGESSETKQMMLVR